MATKAVKRWGEIDVSDYRYRGLDFAPDMQDGETVAEILGTSIDDASAAAGLKIDQDTNPPKVVDGTIVTFWVLVDAARQTAPYWRGNKTATVGVRVKTSTGQIIELAGRQRIAKCRTIG